MQARGGRRLPAQRPPSAPASAASSVPARSTGTPAATSAPAISSADSPMRYARSPCLNAGGKRRVRLVLPAAAEDHVQPCLRERGERAKRRRDVRRLRVVDVANAAELADELDAMRDALERARAPRRSRHRRSAAARAAAVAAAAFSRLCGPGMSGSAGSASSRRELDPRRVPGHVTEAARENGDVLRRSDARRSGASRRRTPRTCRDGRGDRARG